METKVVKCQYCEAPAELVGGDVIYPHRKDLSGMKFWLCKPCEAYVGTHNGSKDHKPLGNLAKEDLRRLKSSAHSHFDPVWIVGDMTRKEAYQWLAEQLGIDVKKCHIGYFSIEQCETVIELCRVRKANEN